MGLLMIVNSRIQFSFRHLVVLSQIQQKWCHTTVEPSKSRHIFSLYGNFREAVFVDSVLNKYDVYSSQLLFSNGPVQLTEDKLQTLSCSLKEAIASQNLEELCNLGEQIPFHKGQHSNLIKQLNSSKNFLYSIKLSQRLTTSIEQLQADFNILELNHLLRLLFYNNRWLGNDAIGGVITSLDKIMIRKVNEIDIKTWCRFAHLKSELATNNSVDIVKHFLRVALPNCTSIANLLAVAVLTEPFTTSIVLTPEQIHQIQRTFSYTSLKHAKLILRDIDALAVVCRALFTIDGGIRKLDRSFISLLWEAIAHHMKHYSENTLSTGLALCLKQGSFSMDKNMLKNYPYLLDKTFSSIASVLPTLCRVSPLMGIKVFYGMVQSRHVDAAMAQQFLKYSTTINWHHHRVKEVAMAILAATNYGCTNPDVYKPMLEFVLSSECSKQFTEHPMALVTVLTGLSYVGTFPHSLYQLLFEQVSRHTPQAKALISSRHSLQKILYLNRAIVIHAPKYSGPLLDKRITDMYSPTHVKEARKDGSLQPHHALVKEIMDCINTLPMITTRYIVEKKTVLEDSWLKDIVLSTMGKSQKIVVIAVQSETHFLRVYHGENFTSQKKFTLQLLGFSRTRCLDLQKLGYTVISVKFNEYADAQNKSEFLLDKFKAANAL